MHWEQPSPDGRNPSFTLPACPMCSTFTFLDRPFWKLARHTTAERGRSCYQFLGCPHAGQVVDPKKIEDDPDAWKACEDAWAHAVEQLLTAKTANWPPQSIDRLRRTLEDRTAIPGFTERMKL